MAKRNDKTQGVVFVLPKSKEFFGRISEDFQKTGVKGQTQKIISERTELVNTNVAQTEVHAERELESLKELKDNLSKLVHLHSKLKHMLDELDELVEETEKEKD